MKLRLGMGGSGVRALTVPLAAILAAGVAFAQAVPSVTAKLQPAAAVSLGLANGDIHARLAERAFVESGGRERLHPAVRAQLRSALLEHPLHPRAIRLLALDSEMGGDLGSAESLMRASNRVSRRDLPTQFWLMREEAKAENWDAAIAHLDAGLSSKAEIWPQLFPPMTDQLDNVRFRASLAAFLRQGRPWTIPFINHVVTKAGNVDLLNDLFRAARPLSGGQPVRDLLAPVVARMVASGKLAQARAFAIDVIGVDRAQLDDFAIPRVDSRGVAEPLLWQKGQAESLSVSFEGSSARVSATTTSPVSALTRYMMVNSLSSYALRYNANALGGDTSDGVEWVIQCPDGLELRPIHREPLAFDTTGTELRFRVPQGCRSVRIDLVVGGGASGSGITFSVVPISLDRI